MDYYKEDGTITVVALMMLVVLTILGISISRTATIDIQIAGNELFQKQDFYVAEGGVHREAQEIGSGNYVVTDVLNPHVVATESSAGLPPPTPHQVMGESYDFTLSYVGYFIPPAGYSATNFSRYDYNIDAQQGNLGVNARYYQIGPKADE